jgi:flagellar biosynthetic protein FlhB
MGDKTEKATQKRRDDERKKGNVFQGREINIAFNLLILLVSLRYLGGYLYNYMYRTVAHYISEAGTVEYITQSGSIRILFGAMLSLLILSLPLLMISALASFIMSGVQTKFIFNFKSLRFKIDRLNPINGFKRQLSPRSAIHMIKSIVTIIVISVVIYTNIVDFARMIPTYYYIPVRQALASIASEFYRIFLKVCVVIVVIGVLDYIVQWWQHEKDIRMTKQEVKEEYKMTEGDPQVKSAIKSRQQSMSRRRMMQKVPTADVIIVNPEHYAVALKYDESKGSAPVVVAKGVDLIAQKIKEIARENNIRIEENPPLARALYKAVKLDQEIPAEFYQAVAEILSYVYSIRNVRKLTGRPVKR